MTGNQNEDRSAQEPDDDAPDETSADSKSSGSSPKVLAYRPPGPRDVVSSAGFFTIYKKGQGYWTRMLTAAGALILLALTAHFLYTQLPTWVGQQHKKIVIGAVVAFVVAVAFWLYRMMNKPVNVDFLIATDSEMKKVNWASRSELIGSTKVVIAFMFLTAFVLFGIDQVLHTLFWLIKVLIDPPFFIPK